MNKILTRFCAVCLLASTAGVNQQLSAADLPYEITFTKANSSEWTVIDGNGDADPNFYNKVWCWNDRNGYYVYNLIGSSTVSNDWTISPAFQLQAGTQYEISYYFYGDSGGSSKNIPVSILLMTAQEQQPDATVIAAYPPAEGGSTSKTGTDYTAKFTAPGTGTYYIGVYCSAPYNSSNCTGKLVFRNFGIKALQKATAPGAMTALTVTPGAEGASSATLSFTAPTLDAEGNTLTGNVKVNLYREDAETPFFTSGEMVPGAQGTAVDDEPFAGETWYMARGVNDAGEGAALRADAWIGEDLATAVSNLAVTVGDGSNTVSWAAPTGALHGGYVDFANLSYKVSRIVNGELSDLGTVKALSYADETANNSQTNVSYQVVPVSGAGFGQQLQSGFYNCGPQYQLPFAESFAGKKYQTSPWLQETLKNFEGASYSPEWTLIDNDIVNVGADDDNPDGTDVTITSQDTDQGFIRFNSNAVGKMKEAARGRLVFPAVDLKGMSNPVLSFYMMRETYYTTDPATNGGYRDDFVEVEGRSANGEFSKVEGGEFHRYGVEDAWVKCEVPLFGFAGKDRVQVAFVGNGFGGGPIYIDNIRIEERIAHDLQALALAGPARARVGEVATFNLSVKNAGGSEATGYTVELLKDGNTVASVDGQSLTPGRTATLRLEYTPAVGEEGADAQFAGRIIYAADQEIANNLSNSVETRITAPLLPAVTGLTAEVNDGEVTLAWGKPSYLPAETLVEEDGFESYEPFAINGFGNFSCFDIDNRITFGIGQASGIEYENSGEKIAYQIFAPSLTNLDAEELPLWQPHTGVNMAIAPQAMASGEATTSDDWLLFPQLSGNTQTIKLFARSVSDTYSEFVQGYYTTTASPSEPADFLGCPDGGSTSYGVPADWTQLTYSVPKGAKFFALRHVSADGYALMIDDVTYERAIPSADECGLTGYSVYCNGAKVADVEGDTRTAKHTPGADGEYEYTVAAAYPAGESSKCESVKVNVTGSGLGEITGDTFAVITSGMRVTVSGAAGQSVELYTPAGMMVDKAFSTGNATVAASQAGVYVLRVGNRAMKVVLR